MFTTIIAKHPGTCQRCGKAFGIGTRIRYGGRNRTYHLSAECQTFTGGGATPRQDTRGQLARDEMVARALDIDRLAEDHAAWVTREV